MATITATLPTDWVAPIRGVDSQEQFSLKANDAWVKLRSEITPQTNLFGTQANSLRDEVNGFRAEALSSKNSASTSATTATTQAGIATTRASEALASKNSAEASATTATAQANIAKGYADSIEPSTLVKIRSTNITVTVGSGGNYPTINAALEYLSGFYPLYKKNGVTATINLLAGFVMAEQVLVRGIDLGWITIAGVDAETNITHTALTTTFEDYYPAFGVSQGGTLPRIGQLFNMNLGLAGASSQKHGVFAFGTGSSAEILSGCGVRNAGASGIYAERGSVINALGANASGAGQYGIYAALASVINAHNAKASGAGSFGIYATTGSSINARNANARIGATDSASDFRVDFGSFITKSGGTGGVSQTVNTLTSNGIIFG